MNDLITQLGSTSDYYKLFTFTLFSISGVLLHFTKKYLKKEIKSNLFRYLFKSHVRQTILMLMALFGSIFTLFLSNQIQSIPLQQLILLAVTTGYTIDSAINTSE